MLRYSLFLPLLLLENGCMDTTLNPIKDDPDEGAPKIQIDPMLCDFGYVPPGETSSAVFSLVSSGDATLNVTAMTVSEGDVWFSLVSPVLGSYLPDEYTEFTVTYNSTGTESEGKLEILSNDPDSPNSVVLLTAHEEEVIDTGEPEDTAPPLSAPVAVCSSDPSEVLAIHETADWIGNSSYDTDGGSIVDYRWTLLSSPAGATATMPGGGANRRNFAPDVAGEYVAELVVIDDDNLASDPCYATLNATAGDGLWIEMFWERSGDDMDLHLLAPGGSLADYFTDCYYANCTGGLEWGVSGTSDNPYLDLDDIPGTGPENINVDSPSRGTYTVYVHDYPGSVYNGTNNVTVNVYWGGRLIWTDTRNVNSEGYYAPFVAVAVPSGVATSL